MTNSCFLATPIFGQTVTGVFLSDLNDLKTSFDPTMTLRQINLCGTNGAFEGIQGIVSNGTKVVNLTPFGRMSSCEAWQVPDGDYVKSIELSYTTLGLQHILIMTHKNAVKTRGTKAQNSSTYKATYDRLNPVVGFAAYQTTSIKALGF